MKKLKILAWLLALILFLECAYCVAVFTDWTPLSELRDVYIETALGTMNHKWLATAFLPGDIVQSAWEEMEASRNAQAGHNSEGWTISTEPSETAATEQDAFFDLFPELPEDTVLAWVETHPETVEMAGRIFM